MYPDTFSSRDKPEPSSLVQGPPTLQGLALMATLRHSLHLFSVASPLQVLGVRGSEEEAAPRATAEARDLCYFVL